MLSKDELADERVKLIVDFLNRSAVSFLAIGFIAPLFAIFLGVPKDANHFGQYFVVLVLGVIGAGSTHLWASRVVGEIGQRLE